MSDLDPILRCDSCSALVRVGTIHKIGCCDKCGNRRMRSLTIVSEQEIEQMENWGFLDFASEFKGVADAE